MAEPRYVIGFSPDPWVLMLEPIKDPERAINWQRVGQGSFDRWEICTRTGPTTFVAEQGGETFEVHQGPFTDEAWARFRASWKELA